MDNSSAILTSEERTRITELQDLLIDRFVRHKEAIVSGQGARAKALEAQINDLLHEKEEIEKWAVVGSA
jgi:hypothetical protein